MDQATGKQTPGFWDFMDGERSTGSLSRRALGFAAGPDFEV
jgi:hypothetical protein